MTTDIHSNPRAPVRDEERIGPMHAPKANAAFTMPERESLMTSKSYLSESVTPVCITLRAGITAKLTPRPFFRKGIKYVKKNTCEKIIEPGRKACGGKILSRKTHAKKT